MNFTRFNSYLNNIKKYRKKYNKQYNLVNPKFLNWSKLVKKKNTLKKIFDNLINKKK